MKQLALALLLGSVTAAACPEISGNWNCYEKSFDAHYKENFQISKNADVFTYTQTLTDENGEQPTFDKVTDNQVRTVEHLAMGDSEYFFKQNSFCPNENTLQTHEVDERAVKGQLVAKSMAEYILRLEDDGTLSMITNSVDEDGTHYDNDWVGVCTRAP